MLLKLREALNKNSAIVTIAAVVLLIMSLGIIIWTIKPTKYKPRIVDVWYFDMGTGKVFTAKSNEIPPINAPSGGAGPDSMPTGVRAYLYACGECPTNLADKTVEELYSQEVFVGWLEMYTPESKERMEAMARGDVKIDPQMYAGPEMFDMVEQGHLVKGLDSEEWVPANSEPGFKIMQDLQMMCGEGKMPKPCFPPRK